jgi:long-subunit acyl-CoA synthetase (AMP-forming)
MSKSEMINLQDISDLLRDNPERTLTFLDGTGSTVTSFGDLYIDVQRCVQRAVAAGVTRGSTVAVIAENSIAALVIDFALLQLACTTVQVPEAGALDTLRLTGVERIDFVVSSTRYRHLFDTEAWQVCTELAGMVAFRPAHRHAVADGQHPHAAAIIFSSGTAGRVKKILVDGDTVLHNAQNFFSALAVSAADRFLIFLPLSNYQQKLLVYGCLMNGAEIVLSDTANVLNALKNLAPTLFLAPPIFYESAWKLAGGSVEKLRTFFGGNIRMTLSGMAPLAPAILTGFHAAGLPLFEAYGMTEYGPIATNRPGHNRIGSVGRPLVDGSVSLAADGEIMLHSARRLTSGYLDETRAVQDAVYLDASRIATGDLGAIDADGYVSILGRKSEVVMTSAGYKIHPRAIEEQIAVLSGVVHAVLMGNQRPDLGMLVILDDATDTIDATRDAVMTCIQRLNRELGRALAIRHVAFEHGAFTAENGLLTRNLKLNRRHIAERYEERVYRSAVPQLPLPV